VTPLYPAKLALASLTGGGRSVGLDPHGLLRQGLLLNKFLRNELLPVLEQYITLSLKIQFLLLLVKSNVFFWQY
jgi:hypothetical protein